MKGYSADAPGVSAAEEPFMRFRWKPLVLSLAVLAILVGVIFFANGSVQQVFAPLRGKDAGEDVRMPVTYDSMRLLEFKADADHVRPIGRTYNARGACWFSFSGCGVEFRCNGTSLSLTMLVENGDALEEQHKPRIAVFVNDEMVVDTVLEDVRQTIAVPFYAFEKEAVVRVIKLSESMYSCVGISDIRLYGSMDILPTERTKQVIEFIGDSITAGFGVDHEKRKGEFSTRTENYCKTYAYLAAEALGAEGYGIAYSGFGVVSGWTSTGKINDVNVLAKQYTKALDGLLVGGATPQWYFEAPLPDLIVINLGTNDHTYCSTKARCKEFEKAYKELLELVRRKNPGVPIVCILGDMNDTMYPHIEKAVKAFNKKDDGPKVLCTPINFNMAKLGVVLHGHPTAQSNEHAAKELTDYLWDKITDKINTKEDLVNAIRTLISQQEKT